ncbi:hypothetical protein N9B17_06050 [Rhodopirellula sp.]|nr:hypothetical protein [Rhodopirellula sp.]
MNQSSVGQLANRISSVANAVIMRVSDLCLFRVFCAVCFVTFISQVGMSQKADLSAAPLGGGDGAKAGKLVLVVGAAGTTEFGEEFREWGERWRKVAEQSGLQFVSIGSEENQGAATDRDLLRESLNPAPDESTQPLWVVLIGHGTYARDVAKFNLRGPDVSGADLAEWLTGVARPVVIVNCASASGPFVNRLSGPNRIVVTATRSGIEQNYARFGNYLSEAIGSPESDLDHDGEVSIQEAFLRASAGVRMFYQAEDRIETEHSLIDDNGDGKGTPATMFRGVRPNARAKDGLALDGTTALRITVAPSGGRLPFTLKELQERAEIESEIDLLRAKIGKLDRQALDVALLPLMLRLSRIYQEAQVRATDDEK